MLTGGAKQMPPTNGGPKTAAGAKCDFITDGYLELPEFPALPKHFDKFESAPILPIPRLLPSLHHLRRESGAWHHARTPGHTARKDLAVGGGGGERVVPRLQRARDRLASWLLTLPA